MDFLPEATARAVLAAILDRQQEFRPLTGNPNFLRLPTPLDVLPGFSDRLLAVLPEVQDRLGIDLARPQIELYVHAYNDGTRFARHSDAHGGGNWRRRLSCVYWCIACPGPSPAATWSSTTGAGRPTRSRPRTIPRCPSPAIRSTRCGW